MEIKILGSGCSKCKELEQRVREIVKNDNIDATIVKVQDYQEIIKYGVMSTPALVVNEKVEIKGRVATKKEIKDILAKC